MRPTGSIPKCQTQHFRLNFPDKQQSLMVVVLAILKESVIASQLTLGCDQEVRCLIRLNPLINCYTNVVISIWLNSCNKSTKYILSCLLIFVRIEKLIDSELCPGASRCNRGVKMYIDFICGHQSGFRGSEQ